MADNPLSAIFENPDAMRRISELAGEFGNMSHQPENQNRTDDMPDPSSELMLRAMPILSSIAESGKQYANPDRQRLLSALKPFISVSASAQFDKAFRLLSMAQMTRTAASQFLAPHTESKSED